MNNKYRVKIDDVPGYVRVNGKRFSIINAADIFRVRMLNTMNAMENGVLSRAIDVIVKEVESEN